MAPGPPSRRRRRPSHSTNRPARLQNCSTSACALDSAQQPSEFLSPNDWRWRREYPASEYSETQSTRQPSLFSFSGEDEATQYSGLPSDAASLAPPLGFDAAQSPLGASFDEDLIDETARSLDTGEPLAEQDVGVATIELYSMGSLFASTFHLNETSQSIQGQPVPLVLPVPLGDEGLLLPLDATEQLELMEPPDPSGQFDPTEQSFPSGQLLSLHWRNNSNLVPTFPQEDMHESPWSAQSTLPRGQHQPTHLLRPPLPHYHPESSQPWAGTLTASTAPSSQGSQRGGSQPPALRCNSCAKEFKTHKALDRHRSKAAPHQDVEDGVFICKCGSTTNRKDNFKSRHFENCPRQHLHQPSDVYTCICNYQDARVSSMEEHFKSCPCQKKRGRPPLRSTPSPRSHSSYS